MGLSQSILIAFIFSFVMLHGVVNRIVAQVWRLVPLRSLLTPAMPQVLEVGHTTDRYNESAGTKLFSDIEKELLETDKLLKGVLNRVDKCEKQI